MPGESRGSSVEDNYQNEGKKNENLTTCSIVVGILAYLLLFMKSLFWVVMFFIFSFKTNLP